MGEQQRTAPKVGVVNGLRGFAVLAVIYHHLFAYATPAAPLLAGIPAPIFAPLNHGWLGVNLFFVLSGFVLYLPFASGTRSCDDLQGAISFFKRRCARLLPLYYFNVLFALAFIVLPTPPLVRNLLLMATLTFPFTLDQFMPWCNWVLWSLGIEFWFSVVFPLLLLLSRRVSLRELFLMALVLGLATRFAAFLVLPVDYTERNFDPIRASLPARLDDFVAGMLVAHWCVRGRLSTRAALPLVLAGLALLYVTTLLWDWCSLGVLPNILNPLFNNVAQLGSVALLAGLLALERGIVKWIFDNNVIQVIGMMCFSLYVWHALLTITLGANHWAAFPNPAIGLAFYFVLLFLISGLTYRFIEFGTEKDWKKLFRGVMEPVRTRTGLDLAAPIVGYDNQDGQQAIAKQEKG